MPNPEQTYKIELYTSTMVEEMPGKKLINRLLNRKQSVTPVDVLAGYAHWAKHYPPTAHNPLMEIEQQAMLSLLPDNLSGKTCLDLACGSGRYLHLMQQRGANKIFGIDYSPEMLAKAGEQLTINNEQLIIDNEQSQISSLQSPIPNYQLSIINYQLIQAPFFPLPVKSNHFDLITCGLAVGHEQNLSQVLAEVGRLLKPGGNFLYSDFHPFGTMLGWQRTFTADNGAVFSLEHHLHLYSHHQQACRAAGLTIEAVLEPLAGENAPPEAQNIPAVLVIRAVKKT